MRRAVNNILPLNRKLGHTIAKSLKLDLNQIQEFYILLDEPHRVYKPSEEVCGQVILILKKNLTDVFITLSLTGVVKIAGDGSALRGSKKSYLFNHAITLYGGNNNNNNNESNQPANSSSLAKGEHRFPFIVKLPKKNVYTNVSFEKGEIRYSLKASISDSSHNHPSIFESIEDNTSPTTNPTDISTSNNNTYINSSKLSNHPILTCEKYFSIVKPINISLLPPPQPKIVSFKIPQKGLKKTVSSTSTINSTNSLDNHHINALSPPSNDNFTNSPENTNISDQETINNNNNNELDHLENSSPSVIPSPINSSIPPSIKISLQVGATGYLRGESISVKVNIQHFKNIKNVNGIIVTLIRVCRIDLGSDHALQSFRKDLSQSIIPLYIDPQTFTCSASTSLRIPLDAFPTIVGCDLVSFQYYIEAVVNLSSGKLNNTFNQSKPKIDHGLDDEDLSNVLDPSNDSQLSSSAIYNVDRLKIMKNVITLTNGIVVGTERKTISNLKRRSNVSSETGSIHTSTNLNSPGANIASLRSNSSSSTPSPSQTQFQSNNTPISSPLVSSNYQFQPINFNSNSNSNNSHTSINVNQMPMTPMDSDNPTPSYSANLPASLPDLPPPMTNLSEKEVLRLREEALLPSQPTFDTDNNDTNITPNSDNSNSANELDHYHITPLHSLSDRNELGNYANIPPSSTPPPPSQLDPLGIHHNSLESDLDSLDHVPAYEETPVNN